MQTKSLFFFFLFWVWILSLASIRNGAVMRGSLNVLLENYGKLLVWNIIRFLSKGQFCLIGSSFISIQIRNIEINTNMCRLTIWMAHLLREIASKLNPLLCLLCTIAYCIQCIFYNFLLRNLIMSYHWQWIIELAAAAAEQTKRR